MVLALQMRARQQLATLGPREAKYVTDAVDDGLVAERAQLCLQPVQSLHVLRRQGRPMHTSLVFSDFGQLTQVCDDACAIRLEHGSAQLFVFIWAKSAEYSSEQNVPPW